ncbi:MAG: thymidylate synthase, partial [Desulfobacterales bacterium]|nr:thymidylate synthase [Desulfobacterales bacterium]
NPVEHDYLYGGEGYERAYIEYLMSSRKEPGESYTYGERLTKAPLAGDKLAWWKEKNAEIIDAREVDGNVLFEENDQLYLNQIEWVIDTYKKHGERNNQMVLQVAHPSDLTLLDPPCLRSIDTRIQDDTLYFFVYFRSWDLWNGFPANLGAIQNLKEYMAGEIGVKDGEMIVESKGLHLYGYTEDLAKLRCLKM